MRFHEVDDNINGELEATPLKKKSEELNLKDPKNKTLRDINKLARKLGVEGASTMRKQELIWSLLLI